MLLHVQKSHVLIFLPLYHIGVGELQRSWYNSRYGTLAVTIGIPILLPNICFCLSFLSSFRDSFIFSTFFLWRFTLTFLIVEFRFDKFHISSFFKFSTISFARILGAIVFRSVSLTASSLAMWARAGFFS